MRFDAALTFPIIDSTLGSRGPIFEGLKDFRGIAAFGCLVMNSSAVPGFDLETFYSVDVKAFTDVLSSLERRIPKDAQPQDDEFLQELTAAIHRSRVDCRVAEKAIGNNPQLLKEVQEQFRARISPYFDQSWFMHLSLIHI